MAENERPKQQDNESPQEVDIFGPKTRGHKWIAARYPDWLREIPQKSRFYKHLITAKAMDEQMTVSGLTVEDINGTETKLS